MKLKHRSLQFLAGATVILILSTSAPRAFSQQSAGPPPSDMGDGPHPCMDVPPPLRGGRPPLERALGGPPGRWWNNPDLVRELGLTSAQQKTMDASSSGLGLT